MLNNPHVSEYTKYFNCANFRFFFPIDVFSFRRKGKTTENPYFKYYYGTVNHDTPWSTLSISRFNGKRKYIYRPGKPQRYRNLLKIYYLANNKDYDFHHSVYKVCYGIETILRRKCPKCESYRLYYDMNYRWSGVKFRQYNGKVFMDQDIVELKKYLLMS